MDCIHCQTPIPANSRFCLSCGADLSDPGSGPRSTSTPEDIQTKLARALEGRFAITRMVGRGGMGAVFLAEDLTLERPVAIKVLPPEVSRDANLVGRFEREARTAAKLDHPNIIPIHSVESVDDLHFFVMKFVDGRSLEAQVEQGPMEIGECRRILWEAARALGHAHQRGVVHRDIKPGNILLDHEGRVLVADFGISKASHAATQLTGTGQVLGTPHYMSPEQVMGQSVDGRSDQYSLAVMGYQLLTGRLPINDEGVHTVLYKHIFEEPDRIERLRPDTPERLASALHRALSKDAAKRYPTMEAFAEAIWSEQGYIPTAAAPPGAAAPGAIRVSTTAPTEISGAAEAPTIRSDAAEPVPRRRRGRLAAGLAALALILAAGAYLAWDSGLVGSRNQMGRVAAEPGSGAEDLGASDEAATDANETPTLSGASDSVETSSSTPASPPPVTVDPSPRIVDETPTPVERSQTREPQRANPGRGNGQRDAPGQARRRTEPALGFLTVDADPFGLLFIDGVEIGITPIARHPLEPGAHVIRITRDGCRDVVDTIMVNAGSRATVRKTLTCG